MGILAHFIAWLNVISNGLFGLLRIPMTALPPWLSLTLISAVLGVLMLMVFKYTSDQTAIGRVRDAIKAHLLAMKLFKDNIPVVLKSQIKILLNALMLLIHSFRPMLVMIIPFSLFLGQMGLWYQSRPLSIGEQALVTLAVSGAAEDPMPQVSLKPSAAAQTTAGPVYVPAKRQVFWQVEAVEPGLSTLTFEVDHQQVQKEFAVGDGLMPVSMTRPSLHVGSLILHPAEKPFEKSSLVQSITIDYPDRPSKVTGTDVWIISLFVISMAVAFMVKPFFNVKL